MKTAATLALSLALHLVLGWAWTLGAGLAVGLWAGRRGWAVGAAGVGLGWLALVLWNLSVAARPVWTMLGDVGAIFGGVPPLVLAAVPVLLGVLIGGLGGALGSQLRPWLF